MLEKNSSPCGTLVAHGLILSDSVLKEENFQVTKKREDN